MNRIFGRSKPKKDVPPPMSLEEVSEKMSKKSGAIDAKIATLDKQILELKKKMKSSRGPAQKRYKQQAIQLLKRRRMYDNQANLHATQQFNIDQMSFTMDSIKDTQATVATMKETAATMKTQFKEMNIDEVEDVYDDLEDLMEDASEINEIMGRSMGNMDEIDDDELEAELEGLDEMDLMEDLAGEATPSYLNEESMPAIPAQDPGDAGGGGGGGIKEPVDEFGLPVSS